MSVGDFPLFSRLSEPQRILLDRASTEVQFEENQRLFSEGEPAHGCWLIHSGRIALDVTVPGRGSMVVQTLGQGDILGWSWLVPPYVWHFGATAVEPTAAASLDTVQLRALSAQDPRFGLTLTLCLFEALLERLQATRARLLDLYGVPNAG